MDRGKSLKLNNMVSNRLKKIIFDKLNKDLSKVEIIPHNNNIWFIDRENKYWYFELKQDGHLWWRYSFFIDFFRLFSLSYKEFEPIISEWVELILNRAELSPIHSINDYRNKVNEVLNSKVCKTDYYGGSFPNLVEEALNSKLFTKINPSINPMSRVEEALNSKVFTISSGTLTTNDFVDDVLSQT